MIPEWEHRLFFCVLAGGAAFNVRWTIHDAVAERCKGQQASGTEANSSRIGFEELDARSQCESQLLNSEPLEWRAQE